MWKADTELRDQLSSLQFWIGDIAKAGKEPACRIARTDGDMAVEANHRRGSFTREELFAMTIQARRVLGKIGDILESCLSFAHFLPILRRNFVTRTAFQLLGNNMSAMREPGIIDARLRWGSGFLLDTSPRYTALGRSTA